jgi:hypothetical protein
MFHGRSAPLHVASPRDAPVTISVVHCFCLARHLQFEKDSRILALAELQWNLIGRIDFADFSDLAFEFVV